MDQTRPHGDQAPQPVVKTDAVPGVDEGFADALLNVSMPDRPVHAIAMLFEVQRLSQDDDPASRRADVAADAVIAYQESRDRASRGNSMSAFTAIRA
ncbi:hypothetical protein [Minwuia sp.]|uniref:hypothetical protein n=1 Tax=Minwuia sp. TaxID=2493630 RepID=UPI003A8D61BD